LSKQREIGLRGLGSAATPDCTCNWYIIFLGDFDEDTVSEAILRKNKVSYMKRKPANLNIIEYM